MNIIYRPKGAAREYAELAANLYSGCTHGCRYCYVPSVLRRSAMDFHSAAPPRTNVLQLLQKDIAKGVIDRVHLCFTCDPYPAEGSETTRQALLMFRDADIPVSILTKAGLRATWDFDLLATMDAQFGVTLAWSSDEMRREWEPYAAPVWERIESLEMAKSEGIATWASVEPVIDPAQGLGAIAALLPVADTIKVGRWNHSVEANKIDWQEFARKARAALGDHPHLFKRGLAER